MCYVSSDIKALEFFVSLRLWVSTGGLGLPGLWVPSPLSGVCLSDCVTGRHKQQGGEGEVSCGVIRYSEEGTSAKASLLQWKRVAKSSQLE